MANAQINLWRDGRYGWQDILRGMPVVGNKQWKYFPEKGNNNSSGHM